MLVPPRHALQARAPTGGAEGGGTPGRGPPCKRGRPPTATSGPAPAPEDGVSRFRLGSDVRRLGGWELGKDRMGEAFLFLSLSQFPTVLFPVLLP